MGLLANKREGVDDIWMPKTMHYISWQNTSDLRDSGNQNGLYMIPHLQTALPKSMAVVPSKIPPFAWFDFISFHQQSTGFFWIVEPAKKLTKPPRCCWSSSSSHLSTLRMTLYSRVRNVSPNHQWLEIPWFLPICSINAKFIWVFPKIVVPQNGWFIREHPIKMDDLGVPLFLETPIYIYHTLMVFHVGKYSHKKMEKTPDSGWSMKKLGWWLNQPILKMCSSNWIISPARDENSKNIWKHHLTRVINLTYRILNL